MGLVERIVVWIYGCNIELCVDVGCAEAKATFGCSSRLYYL